MREYVVDALGMVGFVLVVVGVGLIHFEAGLIVAGVLLITTAVLLGIHRDKDDAGP